jgi:hypothetical protein
MTPLVGRAVGAAGAAVIASALVVALPVFGPRAATLAVLAVGGLLLLVGSFAGTDGAPPKKKTFIKMWKWGALGCFAVFVLGGSYFVDLRIDVTRAAVNTLADESVAVAKALPAPVRVIAFVEGDRRAADELQSLVDRYAAVTDAVRLERRSPAVAADLEVARATGLAELLAVGGPNVAVVGAGVEMSGDAVVRVRFDAGQPDAEEQLTNALRRATTTTAPARVYVMAGHGEADVRDEGPAGLARLRDGLRARHVELVPLPLQAAGLRVPEDARALVALPTAVVWTDDERTAVRSFVDAGGALFVLIEPDSLQPASSSLAALAGIDVLPDVVVDEGPFVTLLGGADIVTGSTQLGHAITRPLKGALTHFPRAVVLGLSPVPGVRTTPLVSSGAEARATKIAAVGPLPLVVAAEADLAADPGAPAGAGPRPPRRRQRMVVAADATFLTNAAIGLGANRDLAHNAVQWLVQDDEHIVVRPRQRGGSLVFLTPSAREALAFALLVVVPALLGAIGAAVSAVRRAR